MTKIGIVFGLMVGLLWTDVASAQDQPYDTVTVQYLGVSTYGVVKIYRDGAYFGRYYAAPMKLKINGEANQAFCIDLDHWIHYGQVYQAEVYPAPRDPMYCQMAYISDNYPVTSNFSGSVLQVAIWKLIYGIDNLWVTTSSIENAANALLAASEGTCPMGCTEEINLDLNIVPDHDGMLHVYASLFEGGEPVVGELITLTSGNGTVAGETDAGGLFYAAFDVAGMVPFTVEATANGRWLYVVDPIPNVQTLQTLTYGEECTYSASATFDPTPLGDPHTIGFWKHQARAALGKNNGQVPAGALLSWLPIEVLGLTVDSLEGLYEALWLKNAPMSERAQQQCLATMLNLNYGELGWFTEIDLGDGMYWFFELYGEAQAAFDAGEFETAKTICDDINNL